MEMPLGEVDVFEFSNENIFVRFEENVRARDVFIVQTMAPPVNTRIMELFIMIDAARRASAGRITAVVPYYPYSRSDKKDQPRVPITARLIANFLETAGADRLLTVDLHAGQIQGFFNIPVDELTARTILANHFKENGIPNLTVVATDVGGAKGARRMADRLDTPLAIVEKRRLGNDERVEAMTIIGEVEGRTVLIVDDEVLTGGTLVTTAEVCNDHGATAVYATATHPIFAGWTASLIADRFRLPALVLFLGLGMAIGSDGTDWIDFEDYELARRIGVITAAAILFEAGLAAGFAEIRPVLRPAVSLATVGTFITAAITGLAAVWLFDFSLLQGLLIGSILAATDSAAVFALLRQVRLPGKLSRTLEAEAGMVDPFAVLLVITFIKLIDEPGFGALDVVWLFVAQLGVGAIAGIGIGWLGLRSLQLVEGLAYRGLHLVGSGAAMALAYGTADVLGGSGFLAAYLAGLVFGSGRLPEKGAVRAFHSGLASLSEVALFLALGLLVSPASSARSLSRVRFSR